PGSCPFPYTTLFRSSRVGTGAPGHEPGAFRRPEAERPRLMASLSQLRPFGLETIQLYVGMVALASAALVVLLVLSHRFSLNVVRSEEHTSELQSLAY